MLTIEKVRPSTHTNISTTHAIEREHLVCLLCVRSNNLVVLLNNNNSLNAIKLIAYFAITITNVEI